jgi:hypothetical protein
MTIAIAVSVSEGLVLAADSRTTRWQQTHDDRPAEVLTDNAVKVFPLGRRAGAATYGRSHLRGLTIAGVAGRFELGRPDGPGDISALIAEFVAYLGRIEPAEAATAGSRTSQQEESIGFLVAGYGPDGTGRIYEIRWPEGKPHLLSTTEAPNYHWRGQGEAVTRLMKGIDGRIDRSELDPQVASRLSALEYNVALSQMSLRDAADFARMLGDAAIGIDRFVTGTTGGTKQQRMVGGHLTVAAVTPQGFQVIPFSGSA